jgi:hypothetical protein
MDNTAGVIDGPTTVSEPRDGLLTEHLALFRGPVDPKDVVNDFIKKETARMERQHQAMGTVVPSDGCQMAETELVQPINEYLELILEIGRAMCGEIQKQFDEERVRVAQVRTKFDFRYWLIRVLFVIDADPEEELRISQMLNQLEKMVILSAPYAAELDYANKRDGQVDAEFLRRSYPFVAKVRAGK